MSYRNLKLSTWTHPKTGKARIYINTRYCDRRDGLIPADGAWIEADEQNACKFHWGHRNWELNGDGWMYALVNVAALIANKAAPLSMDVKDANALLDGLTFDIICDRIESCKTKNGNFSYTRYEKMYDPELKKVC